MPSFYWRFFSLKCLYFYSTLYFLFLFLFFFLFLFLFLLLLLLSLSPICRTQCGLEARRLALTLNELLAASDVMRAEIAAGIAQRFERAIKRMEIKDNKNKDSALAWRMLARFCRMHKLPTNTAHLEECARHNNWMQFLVAAQEQLVPVAELARLVETNFTNEAIKAHLLLVVRRLHSREIGTVPMAALYPLLHGRSSNPNAGGSNDLDSDLVDVVYTALKVGGDLPQRELATAAVTRKEPLLAVLACLCGSDRVACACAWLQARVAHMDDIHPPDAARGRDLSSLLALLLFLGGQRIPGPMLVSVMEKILLL